MRGACAVIGAGYGDEGKGLVVDTLASGDTTVVRFNGGAQAGHTVTTPDGRAHVFHHFGAGAFAGAATHLSRFFLVNPILWAEEAETLRRLGARRDASVDRQAPVTLPFDMMLNQIAERARGAARHGSCGLGIGETIERDAHEALQVRAGDLPNRAKLVSTLARVRRDWIAPRLAALGVGALTAEERDALADPAIDASWLDDAGRFAAVTRLAQAPPPGPLIFEGAQGLKLDQTRGAFPHVTRSNTGCRNVVALTREWGVERLELVYVSRIYRTRHGAGPLARESARAPVARFADLTNADNPWQGRLRFAPLDLDELGLDIAADLEDARGAVSDVTLAMTCFDQAEGEVEFVREGALVAFAPEALARQAGRRVGAGRVLESWGPTRATLGAQKPLRSAIAG